MQPLDLAPDELHAPDATAAELELPRVAAGDEFELADMREKRGGVLDAGESVEHLGDAVI